MPNLTAVIESKERADYSAQTNCGGDGRERQVMDRMIAPCPWAPNSRTITLGDRNGNMSALDSPPNRTMLANTAIARWQRTPPLPPPPPHVLPARPAAEREHRRLANANSVSRELATGPTGPCRPEIPPPNIPAARLPTVENSLSGKHASQDVLHRTFAITAHIALRHASTAM